MENGGCHTVVCWCWLCVTVRYESSRCAHWYIFNLVPCFPPSAYVFRVWWVQHRALIKEQVSSSETRPSKYTFLMVASKKGRQKLYIKNRTPRQGDDKRYRGEWRMDCSAGREEWNSIRPHSSTKKSVKDLTLLSSLFFLVSFLLVKLIPSHELTHEIINQGTNQDTINTIEPLSNNAWSNFAEQSMTS